MVVPGSGEGGGAHRANISHFLFTMIRFYRCASIGPWELLERMKGRPATAGDDSAEVRAFYVPIPHTEVSR